MTTHVEIVAGRNRVLAECALLHMESLVSKINRLDPKSELSLLHKKKGNWQSISSELVSLFALSMQMEEESKGAFRLDYEGFSKKSDGHHGFELNVETKAVFLHADTQLNAGGIGKGFIVDDVVDYLIEQGAEDVLVNAGGDCRVHGVHSWKIGLFNPLDPSITYGHIKLKKGAVTTSGTYARKNHFFDISKKEYMKKPPYVSVTVTGIRAAQSEVYAKLRLMGSRINLPKKYKAMGVSSDDFKVKQWV